MNYAMLIFFVVLLAAFALGVALGVSLAQFWLDLDRARRRREREQAQAAAEAHLANHPDWRDYV